MISKECFVNTICDIIKHAKLEEDINNLLKGYDFCSFGFCEYESIVVKLLEESMDDTEEWISYWLYELDYGSEYSDGCITTEDNKIIDLSTPEKLYDFLVGNYKTNEVAI